MVLSALGEFGKAEETMATQMISLDVNRRSQDFCLSWEYSKLIREVFSKAAGPEASSPLVFEELNFLDLAHVEQLKISVKNILVKVTLRDLFELNGFNGVFLE